MKDEDIAWLQAIELARGIRAGQYSSSEVTEAMLQRVGRIDPGLHAFARLTPEVAIAQAREADARQAKGESLGLLHGVPIAVKDLCWTQGVATMAGMPIHRDFVPTVDGTVVRRLREAGAVLLGKLQMTEGAYSAHHPDVIAPVNPWHAQCWPGVSSSGSGVATAAGLCFGSIGTDTGGSIRFPSAANAVTGLKPTWGRVSRYGAFELAASLDHLGPMCRSAADCGLMLGAIAGADPNDPTALQSPVPDYLSGDIRRLDGLRIGLDEAFGSNGVDAAVADALSAGIDVLRRLGARIIPVRMPDVDELVLSWVPHCAVEAAVAHADTFPSRRAEYGPMLAGLLDEGRAVSGADYQRILLQRADFTGRLNALFGQVDLIAMPAMPFAAPTIEGIAALRQQPGYRKLLSRFTAPTDLSGHPTITFPSGFTPSGLPIAMQLVSAHLSEGALIRVGRAFQETTDWHTRHPVV